MPQRPSSFVRLPPLQHGIFCLILATGCCQALLPALNLRHRFIFQLSAEIAWLSHSRFSSYSNTGKISFQSVQLFATSPETLPSTQTHPSTFSRNGKSTRPNRRPIAPWSRYSGSMDSQAHLLICNHELSFSLLASNRLAKLPPHPHPKCVYCINRTWVFVGTLRGSVGILWPSMGTYPTFAGIKRTSYSQIPVELHNPCVRKIRGRSWTLTRFHAHVTMIIPSPCQAPTDFARIPPTPTSSMYTVSIDRGFLRVL